MPITILDYVKSQAGEKDTYSAADFFSNGVDMLGGCERCTVTIAAYNAYPSTSGYWRCADCIGDSGFGTVEEFTAHDALSQANAEADLAEPDDCGLVNCPLCDGVENIQEIRDRTFECGDCGAVWTA